MTELIWDGKYKDGNRVAPLRVALPFQTVETVNETAQQRQRALDLFSAGRDPEWRNRLIWGDKKYVLPSLLEEFAGKVNLIYIDPPFNVGADFSFTATIPDNPETEEDETTTFVKEPITPRANGCSQLTTCARSSSRISASTSGRCGRRKNSNPNSQRPTLKRYSEHTPNSS